MNKNELVGKVAEDTGVSKAEAARSVQAVFDAITDSLTRGDDVSLIGFGRFSVSSRAATTGRNPQTGTLIEIAAYKQPRFRAGKKLKDAINGK